MIVDIMIFDDMYKNYTGKNEKQRRELNIDIKREF